MTYRVVLQRLAKHDLQSAYDWAAAQAPEAARRWLNRFEQTLQTLSFQPERRPLARESAKSIAKLRELLFGKRPYVFRAIFAIDDQVVRVLRVRRAQARTLTRSELERALRLDT
jgi:plasmid stabilization system protein ParE